MTNDKHSRPGPEVPEKATRRRYTGDFKLRVLQEADRCTEPGQVGQLLRREGLYFSHLTLWRRQRETGTLHGLESQKRGRKPKPPDANAPELQKLRRENQRLAERLRQAETIIEVQKKVSELLGIPLRSPEDDESN